MPTSKRLISFINSENQQFSNLALTLRGYFKELFKALQKCSCFPEVFFFFHIGDEKLQIQNGKKFTCDISH